MLNLPGRDRTSRGEGVFERDLPGGGSVITHVTWADPEHDAARP